MIVYASAIEEINRILGFTDPIQALIRSLIIICVSFAFLYFFSGLVQYIRKEADLDNAKKRMTWGILGIFVLTGVWGLVYFLEQSILGGSQGALPIESLNVL